jgi:CDGSH-type Zn-finger protein
LITVVSVDRLSAGVPEGPAGQGSGVSRPLTDESEVPAADGGATITPYRDGPLIVRGDFRLLDQDGGEIDPGRETIALCRCGKSGIKPFCDGSHKRSGFSAPSRPSRPRPVQTIQDLLQPGQEDATGG